MIANLARGIIGETPSNLMGALLLARVQAAGMARASLPPEARTPFHIVIDEVQLFGTEVIAQILSEARKYGLSLTMATQFMAGLSEKTRAAVMGNVAALIVFRVGHEDAVVLAPEFDRPIRRTIRTPCGSCPEAKLWCASQARRASLWKCTPIPRHAETPSASNNKAASTTALSVKMWKNV